jgi:hypothetical protein
MTLDSTTRQWSLVIAAPAEGFLTINATRRMHWSKERRIARVWRAAAYNAACHAHLPIGLRRIHVDVVLRFVDRKIRDEDNYTLTVKPIIDALGPHRTYVSRGRLVAELGWGVVPGDDSRYLSRSVIIGEPVAKSWRGPAGLVELTITDLSSGSS